MYRLDFYFKKCIIYNTVVNSAVILQPYPSGDTMVQEKTVKHPDAAVEEMKNRRVREAMAGHSRDRAVALWFAANKCALLWVQNTPKAASKAKE